MHLIKGIETGLLSMSPALSSASADFHKSPPLQVIDLKFNGALFNRWAPSLAKEPLYFKS